jgi:CIC family chloride channel protein
MRLLNRYLEFTYGIPENVRSILQTLILSLAAAGAAVLFMTIMNAVYTSLYVRAAALEPRFFLALSFLFIMGSSFIVALLMKMAPEAAGSGIPQAKVAYWKELGYIPFKTVIIKFIAGIVSVGGGASLGREGPTIYLGSGIASFLSGYTGSPKRQRRAATAIGASAGLAAAFNTPLAAITFIIEELVNDLNTRYLGRVVLAALIGALTVHAILGKQPAFALPQVMGTTWIFYLLAPLVAALAAAGGLFFQIGTLRLRERVRQKKLLTRSRVFWLLPLVGGFITWIIGGSTYLLTGHIGIFGLGYQDLSDALTHGSVWWVAGLLVAAKLLATIAGYSFGGCGGIFSPMLFIGGFSGAFIAGVADLWLPVTPADAIVLATVGMSACLGSVIRAPLTSTLIVFEMTHQFEVIPGLMIAAIICQLMARAFRAPHNFYDALLLQDGHELVKIKPPRDLKSWQNLPVTEIMNRNPVTITSLAPVELRRLLSTSPYNVFPYVNHGRVAGLIKRESLQACIENGVLPRIDTAAQCTPDESISDAAQRMVSLSADMVLVTDSQSDVIVGLVTLHDILRAQAAVIE